MKNHYKTIGCDRSASQEQIKASYREKSKQLHPDLAFGRGENQQIKMAELNEAYELLGDPQKRLEYDGQLNVSDDSTEIGLSKGVKQVLPRKEEIVPLAIVVICLAAILLKHIFA